VGLKPEFNATPKEPINSLDLLGRSARGTVRFLVPSNIFQHFLGAVDQFIPRAEESDLKRRKLANDNLFFGYRFSARLSSFARQQNSANSSFSAIILNAASGVIPFFSSIAPPEAPSFLYL